MSAPSTATPTTGYDGTGGRASTVGAPELGTAGSHSAALRPCRPAVARRHALVVLHYRTTALPSSAMSHRQARPRGQATAAEHLVPGPPEEAGAVRYSVALPAAGDPRGED